MKSTAGPNEAIEFFIHEGAQEAFAGVINELEERLQTKVPGTQINYRGSLGSTKDTVAVIYATATLLAASTPALVAFVTAFLARRGFTVEAKADAKGHLAFKVSQELEKPKASVKSRKTKPKP